MPNYNEWFAKSELETRITIKHIDSDLQKGRDREAFWQPFRTEESRSALRLRARDVEAWFLQNFADNVRKGLRSLSSDEFEADAARILVAVRLRAYSSMELGLTLAPVEKVVSLFENNFDYFFTFLNAYIPVAFQDSLPPGVESPALQYDFDVPPAIRHAFARTRFHPATLLTKVVPSTTKAKWLWILSNTSLIVPSILAAIYVLKLADRLQKREDAVDASYRKLIEVQTQALSAKLNSPEPTVSPLPVSSPALPVVSPKPAVISNPTPSPSPGQKS